MGADAPEVGSCLVNDDASQLKTTINTKIIDEYPCRSSVDDSSIWIIAVSAAARRICSSRNSRSANKK
jgi:hypothetical protein